VPKRPGEFLGNMGPYILKLAKVIEYAGPVAGAAAGICTGPIGSGNGREVCEGYSRKD